MHLLDGAEAFGRKTAPAQAFKVQAAHRQRVAIDHHERRHVLRDVAGKTGHGVRTHLYELVDAGQPAHEHPVAQVHMSAQGGIVGQDGLAAGGGRREQGRGLARVRVSGGRRKRADVRSHESEGDGDAVRHRAARGRDVVAVGLQREADRVAGGVFEKPIAVAICPLQAREQSLRLGLIEVVLHQVG